MLLRQSSVSTFVFLNSILVSFGHVPRRLLSVATNGGCTGLLHVSNTHVFTQESTYGFYYCLLSLLMSVDALCSVWQGICLNVTHVVYRLSVSCCCFCKLTWAEVFVWMLSQLRASRVCCLYMDSLCKLMSLVGVLRKLHLPCAYLQTACVFSVFDIFSL